jgi:hypothetical protein
MGAGVLLLAGGCSREKVTSYEVPKEDYSVKPAVMAMGDADAAPAPRAQRALPKVDWKLPAGWKETAGQRMGIGNFKIEGAEGRSAEVRVVPLTAGAEIEAQSVAMWREELGLPEQEDVKGAEIEVGGAKGHFYDFKSPDARIDKKYKARTLAAVVSREEVLWFFKMYGDEETVGAQEQAFRDFLKSITFKDEASQVASAGAGGGGGEMGNWKTPADWKKQKPGQMVMALYAVSKGGGAAEVSVSAFDGATGGLLANVNRWRGQMGLGPIDSADLAKEVKSIDLAGGDKASVVDVTGTNAKSGKPGRLYGLIVQRGEKMWFYKLLGDSGVVESEIGNLNEFAATAH